MVDLGSVFGKERSEASCELVERRARSGAIEAAPGRMFGGLCGVPKEFDLRLGLDGSENAEEGRAVAEVGVRQRPGEQAPLARREPGELDTDPAAIDPVVAQGGRERVGRRRPSVVLQRTGERTGRSAPVGEVEVRAPERVDRGVEPGSTRGEETVHGQDRAPGAENRRTETRERGADASARAQHELLRLDLEAILVAAEVVTFTAEVATIASSLVARIMLAARSFIELETVHCRGLSHSPMSR